MPQVDGEVVAGGDESFDYRVGDGGRRLEALFRFGHLALLSAWHVARVVVEGGAEDELGRERQVVDPVAVRR